MTITDSKRRGFTLIELLVVVAIIGLLSSIVFASLGGARAKGRIAAAQGSMRDIVTSAILCKDGGGTVRIPASPDSNTGGGGNVCSSTTDTATKYRALPSGWNYCDDKETSSGCLNDISVADPVKLKAKGDNKEITCTESGCSTKNATDVDD